MEDNNKYSSSILSIINKDLELYQVPEGYFDRLPEQILEKVQNEGFSNTNAYAVPEGYFNSFADNILQKVKTISLASEVEEELDTIAPLLNTISKNNVYHVPQNYFEQLPLLLAKQNTTENAEHKVIPIHIHTRRKTWRTLAAAAVIAGAVLSGGLYLENNRNENTHNHSSKQYASAVSGNSSDLQENLSDLSDDEIISYLNVPNPETVDDSAGLSGSVSETTQKAISSMTNEELENYLNKPPTNF